MSQHDMNLADAAGAAFRADANGALGALVSLSSGTTAPATTFPYMWWADTTTGWLKQRNAADSGWIVVAQISNWALPSVQTQAATAFTTGGTSTAFTLTPLPAIAALSAGQRFRVTFNAAAGATPTLAVSGLTAKNLKYKDSAGAKQAVTATQIPSGWVADVEYDGTDWVLLEVPVDYEEYQAASTACTGAITTAVAWRLVRVGKLVTLHIPAVSGTTGASGNLAISMGVSLPAKFRPATDHASVGVPIKNNGFPVATPGLVLIGAAGDISIWRDGTIANPFTALAAAGTIYATAVSWML